MLSCSVPSVPPTPQSRAFDDSSWLHTELYNRKKRCVVTGIDNCKTSIRVKLRGIHQLLQEKDWCFVNNSGSITMFRKVRRLRVERVKVRIPFEVFWPSLRHLSLQCMGHLPLPAQSTILKSLSLSFCSIQFSDLATLITNSPELHTVRFSRCEIRHLDFSEAWTNLVELFFESVSCGAGGLAEIYTLPNLTHLSFKRSELSKEVHAELFPPSLTHLTLDSMQLSSSEIFRFIVCAKNLQYLSLRDNRFQGFSKRLRKLEKLLSLDLSQNPLRNVKLDSKTKSFLSFPASLQELRLYETRFALDSSGDIYCLFGRLPSTAFAKTCQVMANKL